MKIAFKLVLLFAAYYGTARFGLSIHAMNKFATLIWPPTGIALTALLLFDEPLWPAIFLAATLVNWVTGAPIFVAALIGVGNTLEAVIGARLIRRDGDFRPGLSRLTDVYHLIFYGAILSTIVSATIGVFALWFGGILVTAQLVPTWLQWWVGDAAAGLTVTPLLLIFGDFLLTRRPLPTVRRMAEFAIFLLVMILASFIVLGGIAGQEIGPFIKEYFLFPVLLWGTMRFGQFGSAPVTFVIAEIGLYSTALGTGPFSGPIHQANMIQLIVFNAVIATTGLILGAAVSERESEKKSAQAANAAKSAFLANMSHEIRTPLGAILGFSELLVSGKTRDADKQSALEAIKRNGTMLSKLINEVLDLSKIEAGKLQIERAAASFSELISDIKTLPSLEASAKNLRFTIECNEPLPATITTDILRLRQVLLNIIGNAIKFTEAGEIGVTVQMAGEGEARRLMFRIEDTGLGISDDQKEHLFQPFHQADASITRKFGGTGLGLALSKRLAKALGGDVVLESGRTQKGTSFIITIDPGEISGRWKADEKAPAPRILADTRSRLKGRNILVVDDNHDNLIMVKKILELEGATVDTAKNGLEALNSAKRISYSVILMDLQMPQMDGFTATQELRRSGYSRPIIALTAHAMREERNRCLANGFNEHICKPIELASLLDVIARIS